MPKLPFSTDWFSFVCAFIKNVCHLKAIKRQTPQKAKLHGQTAVSQQKHSEPSQVHPRPALPVSLHSSQKTSNVC